MRNLGGLDLTVETISADAPNPTLCPSTKRSRSSSDRGSKAAPAARSNPITTCHTVKGAAGGVYATEAACLFAFQKR